MSAEEPSLGSIDRSVIDDAVIARLADWAVRDAEIGRAGEIEALEAKNRKLESDVAFLMHRAALFEDELGRLRGGRVRSFARRFAAALRGRLPGSGPRDV